MSNLHFRQALPEEGLNRGVAQDLTQPAMALTSMNTVESGPGSGAGSGSGSFQQNQNLFQLEALSSYGSNYTNGTNVMMMNNSDMMNLLMNNQNQQQQYTSDLGGDGPISTQTYVQQDYQYQYQAFQNLQNQGITIPTLSNLQSEIMNAAESEHVQNSVTDHQSTNYSGPKTMTSQQESETSKNSNKTSNKTQSPSTNIKSQPSKFGQKSIRDATISQHRDNISQIKHDMFYDSVNKSHRARLHQERIKREQMLQRRKNNNNSMLNSNTQTTGPNESGGSSEKQYLQRQRELIEQDGIELKAKLEINEMKQKKLEMELMRLKEEHDTIKEKEVKRKAAMDEILQDIDQTIIEMDQSIQNNGSTSREMITKNQKLLDPESSIFDTIDSKMSITAPDSLKSQFQSKSSSRSPEYLPDIDLLNERILALLPDLDPALFGSKSSKEKNSDKSDSNNKSQSSSSTKERVITLLARALYKSNQKKLNPQPHIKISTLSWDKDASAETKRVFLSLAESQYNLVLKQCGLSYSSEILLRMIRSKPPFHREIPLLSDEDLAFHPLMQSSKITTYGPGYNSTSSGQKNNSSSSSSASKTGHALGFVNGVKGFKDDFKMLDMMQRAGLPSPADREERRYRTLRSNNRSNSPLYRALEERGGIEARPGSNTNSNSHPSPILDHGTVVIPSSGPGTKTQTQSYSTITEVDEDYGSKISDEWTHEIRKRGVRAAKLKLKERGEREIQNQMMQKKTNINSPSRTGALISSDRESTLMKNLMKDRPFFDRSREERDNASPYAIRDDGWLENVTGVLRLKF